MVSLGINEDKYFMNYFRKFYFIEDKRKVLRHNVRKKLIGGHFMFPPRNFQAQRLKPTDQSCFQSS